MALTINDKIASIEDNGLLELGKGYIFLPKTGYEHIGRVVYSDTHSVKLHAGKKRLANIVSEGSFKQVDFVYFLPMNIEKGTKEEILAAMDDQRINMMFCSMSPDYFINAVSNGNFIYLKQEKALLLAIECSKLLPNYPRMNGLSIYEPTKFIPVDEKQFTIEVVMKHASRQMNIDESKFKNNGKFEKFLKLYI